MLPLVLFAFRLYFWETKTARHGIKCTLIGRDNQRENTKTGDVFSIEMEQLPNKGTSLSFDLSLFSKPSRTFLIRTVRGVQINQSTIFRYTYAYIARYSLYYINLTKSEKCEKV